MPSFQFSISRVLQAIAWFAAACFVLTWIPHAGYSPEHSAVGIAVVFSLAALIGAGLGSLAGKPGRGAIAVVVIFAASLQLAAIIQRLI